MPGKQGMKMPPNTKSLRQNMWRSMRIMRRFTLPDLIRTVPDLQYDNAQKFLRNLVKNGFVAKVGKHVSGRSGSYQQYALINDIGPTVPVMQIGRSKKFLKQEKEEERETEKESAAGTGSLACLSPSSDPSEKSDRSDPAPEVTHDAA